MKFVDLLRTYLNNVVRNIFFITIIIFINPNFSYSHDGQEHNESNLTETSFKSTFTKFYYLNNKEILFKYNYLESEKINNFDLFITNTNNKGLKINKAEIIFVNNNNNQIKFDVNKTNTDGWYQGHIITKEGNYNAKLILDENVIELGNFNVNKSEILINELPNNSIFTSLFILFIFCLFLSLYIFFRKKEVL